MAWRITLMPPPAPVLTVDGRIAQSPYSVLRQLAHDTDMTCPSCGSRSWDACRGRRERPRRLIHWRRFSLAAALWLLRGLAARWSPSLDTDTYAHIVSVIAESGAPMIKDRPMLDDGELSSWRASAASAGRYLRLLDTAGKAHASIICTDTSDLTSAAAPLRGALQAHRDAAFEAQDAPDRQGLRGLAPVRLVAEIEARAVKRRDERIARHAVHRPGAEVGVWTVHWDESGVFRAGRAGALIDAGLAGYAATPRSMEEMIQWWDGGLVEINYPTGEPEVPVRLLDAPRADGVEVPWEEASRGFERAVNDRANPQRRDFDEACRELARRLSNEDIPTWLRAAAANLQKRSPQPPWEALGQSHLGSDSGASGGLWGLEWVSVDLILTTADPIWGQFDRRPESPRVITEALLEAQPQGQAGQHAFVTELFSDPIDLVKRAAWAGPVYALGSGGSHRVFTLKALELPSALATVHLATVDPVIELDELLDAYPRSGEAEDLLGLWRGLLKRGVILGELLESSGVPELASLVWISLPATWFLHDATTATSCNAAYEACYPGAIAGLGIPEEVAYDPNAWTRWLLDS